MSPHHSIPKGPIILFAVMLTTLAAVPAFSQEAGRRRQEDLTGREGWLLRRHVLPGVAIPLAAHGEAVLRVSTRTAPQASVSWESLGPAPIRDCTMVGDGNMSFSGRALAVALDPSSPGTMLVGTAQGGIWRSEDGGASYEPVGDDMPSLAVKVIRFAPSEPSIVYAGSGEPNSKTSIFGMGVFKSMDGGRTWDALPPSGAGWDFRFLAVSGLQVDPRDPNVVFVTTANVLPDRVNPFQPPPAVGPCGIFKSTDGGMTWTMKIQANDYRAYDYPAFDPYPASGYGFLDLELWKADPSVLFAVEHSGGIYRSTDAGEHWQLVTPVKNPGAGAAQGADFPAPVGRWSYWDDDAAAFTNYPVLKRSITTPEFNRIEIGIGQFGTGPSPELANESVYAGYGAVLLLDVNGNGTYDNGTDMEVPVALIFRSADGGQTWRWLGDWMNGGTPAYCDANTNGYENALYDNTVEVNPEDPLDVVVGGNCNYNSHWPSPLDDPQRYLELVWSGIVYRTLDGGESWMDITQGCSGYVEDAAQPPLHGLPQYKCTGTPSSKIVHPDIQSAFFDTQNRRIYFTCDGGVWVCNVRGDGRDGLNDYDWKDLNNDLCTLQLFDHGPHPTDPNQIVDAMQDNSNACWDGQKWEAWDWNQSDGTVARFDPRAPEHVYIGWQYALARSDNGGGNDAANWKTLFEGTLADGEGLPWKTILAIDPVDTSILYVGTLTGVYRSADRGDHFSRLNPGSLDEVTAIGVSPKQHHLVWAGTNTGKVYLFDTKKGKMWERTGSNLPNRWISAIEASPRDAKKATLVFSGYDASSQDRDNGGNGNTGKVFRTTDKGSHWKNISGNITAADGLDIPITCLAVDPKREDEIWIGTDACAAFTSDGGKRWASARGDMPVVAVMGIDVNRTTGYVTLATFGRGVWRARLGK